MKTMKILTLMSLVLTGIIIGIILTANFNVQQPVFAKDTGISHEATDFLGKFNASLSEVADTTKSSVVNISTKKTIKMEQSPFAPFYNDPFFKRFFGDKYRPHGQRKREFKTPALGSGVIVSEDGYILTNNHVIKGADDIKVVLDDKREFEGKVIGTDAKTDLAVVKIDAEKLPAIKIGDSDTLKVGEMVIAIGNPFALNQTVTVGVVSAVGRSKVGIADYEDFIQTDAAINPGNSGGALVNIKGELVGVNTAMFSTSGGYMGIGFAIPTNMADSIMKSIIKYGKVIRGWIGVTIQEVSPDLAEHFGLKEAKGALVTDVSKDSPAEKAGLQRGDLIIEFNGAQVDDTTLLRNMAAAASPGSTVDIKVIRDNRKKTLKVKLGEFPESIMAAQEESVSALKGVYTQDLTPQIRMSQDIPKDVKGVIVTKVDMDSAAFGILRANDIIVEVNRTPVNNMKDFEEAVPDIEDGGSVLLLVSRAGGYRYVTIEQ